VAAACQFGQKTSEFRIAKSFSLRFRGRRGTGGAKATDTVAAESKMLKPGWVRAAGAYPQMRRLVILFATVLAAFAVASSHAQLYPAIQLHTENPPTEAEQKSLVARALANQDTDDDALQVYERVERHVIHDHDMSATAGEDNTLRIIPTGVATARILLAEHGHPTNPATIHEQMIATERLMEVAADANNPQTKRDREKIEKRNNERRELVGAIQQAFIFTWMGREVRDGRTLSKFHLDPNPKYQATSLRTEFLKHATATAWVDEKSAQLARLEAVLMSDISFVGGVAGKVYRDGHALIEQSEVEPGIWLPRLYQYDYTLRKFVFTSEVHSRTEATRYQRIGNPQQALAAIKREISAAGTPARAQE
jgi:hypothetical protein